MRAGLKRTRSPRKLQQIQLRGRAPGSQLASNLAPLRDFREETGNNDTKPETGPERLSLIGLTLVGGGTIDEV